jgi:3-dehydroquinate dehydratase/shikimate dehydrogenase
MKLPRVCVTVTASTPRQLLAAAQTAARATRFVELRLDYLDRPESGLEVIAALRRRRVSCIATLRTMAAGGRFAGTPDEQLGLLRDAAKAGATLMDLELESAESLKAAAVAYLRIAGPLMISFHDFQRTPDQLHAALERLRAFPAELYKLVTWARNHHDNAAVLRLLAGSRGKLVAFTLGDIGRPTRLLALRLGAPFTYAAPERGGVAGLGQFPARELQKQYRVDRLSARTRVYGVVGQPIAHSLSPVIHNAAFAAQRIDAVYLAFEAAGFDDFWGATGVYDLSGLSVTMPHKEAMVRVMDKLDDAAARAGAVNTGVRHGRRWVGHNTDLLGILRPLERRMRLPGARVLVAGAGGAARAAAYAVVSGGGSVVITARRPEQARALAAQVGGAWIDRRALAGERFDAIIHATPLGMAPNTDACFFTSSELNAPVIFETVYTPVETRLLQMARRLRKKVIPGLEMFIEQAVLQYELWIRRRAPRAAMEKAALAELRGATRHA